MDSEIGHSEQLYRAFAWLEDNWQRAAAVAAGVIVIGVVVAFVIWQGGQKQIAASQSLSLLLSGGQEPTAESLQALAEQDQGTMAANRALLLAAGRLFADEKFQEAQAQFESFLNTPEAGSLAAQARFGIAASKEAQNLIEPAIADYKAIVDNPGSGHLIPQARFALAQLYTEQGNTELARIQYEFLAQAPGSSLASEAGARLAEMPPVVSTSLSPAASLSTNSVSTNSP